MKDYYYILGIIKEAKLDEIKTAYRKLSQKFHPDKNDGDAFFTERFKEIQEAYEILSDSKKKIDYDNQIQTESKSTANNGFNFDPIIEFFKADKSTFNFEEEITFSWKTINSDIVKIRPFGIVPPIGQKTYRIKDFKNPDLSFELTAENSNIGRQTKQSLILKNNTFQELYAYFKLIVEKENNASQNNKSHSKEKAKTSKRSIIEFPTDKGLIGIEQNSSIIYPERGKRAYQNGTMAIDGKYKFGFMWYVHIKNGKVTKVSLL